MVAYGNFLWHHLVPGLSGMELTFTATTHTVLCSASVARTALDLSIEAITQVIHECETCVAIKRAMRVKSPWNRGRWVGFQYGEAWQIDYIRPPLQTCQSKQYIFTVVKATTGWLETYLINHTIAWNTSLGPEGQFLASWYPRESRIRQWESLPK